MRIKSPSPVQQTLIGEFAVAPVAGGREIDVVSDDDLLMSVEVESEDTDADVPVWAVINLPSRRCRIEPLFYRTSFTLPCELSLRPLKRLPPIHCGAHNRSANLDKDFLAHRYANKNA